MTSFMNGPYEALEANTKGAGYISVLGTRDTKSCPQNLCKLNWLKNRPLGLILQHYATYIDSQPGTGAGFPVNF